MPVGLLQATPDAIPRYSVAACFGDNKGRQVGLTDIQKITNQMTRSLPLPGCFYFQKGIPFAQDPLARQP